MWAGDEPEDDSPSGIATVIDPVAVDPGRSQIPEESGPIPHRPTSRVVLMSQGVPWDVSIRGGNSDVEDGEDEVDDPLPEVVVATPAELSRVAIDSGFWSLDSVTLETESRMRSCLMRVVPKMMRGVFRTALRFPESCPSPCRWRCGTGDTRVEVVSARTANVVDQTSARCPESNWSSVAPHSRVESGLL